MARYIYTLHAGLKLKRPDIKKLGITKDKIQQVLENPLALDNSEDPVYIVIGESKIL